MRVSREIVTGSQTVHATCLASDCEWEELACGNYRVIRQVYKAIDYHVESTGHEVMAERTFQESYHLDKRAEM